jgi:hypothetical protein
MSEKGWFTSVVSSAFPKGERNMIPTMSRKDSEADIFFISIIIPHKVHDYCYYSRNSKEEKINPLTCFYGTNLFKTRMYLTDLRLFMAKEGYLKGAY